MVELLVGEPQNGETKRAIIACNDYLRMGPGRSLQKLHRNYTESSTESPPSKNLRVLADWSTRFEWVKRAELYDAQMEREKNARRREIMETGLALEYERVLKLKRLAEQLEAQIFYSPDPPAGQPDEWSDEDFTREALREQGDPRALYPLMWLEDVKGIGGGEDFERVVVVRFNTPLISEYRATLDDIAKETGGRKQKHELTGKDGGPITHRDVSELSDEELAAIASAGSYGTAAAQASA